MVVFDWDQNNLKKLRAHRVTAEEVEQALGREPVLICEQDADGEAATSHGETERNRLIAVVLTERDNNKIRVITAYDLDAGQKRDYLERRARVE